jgi:phage-related protein (TIGR01555 family)
MGLLMADIKKDGWANVLTYMGIKGKDRTISNEFQAENRLNQGTLDVLYRSNGIAKRIIDLIAVEMTREWISIENDPERVILSNLESLDAKRKFTNMIRWSRLYGASLIVIGADDGNELDQPLNESAIRSIDFLHVFDRWEVTWTEVDLYNDPTNPSYGLPEKYRITPAHGGMGFMVHESRVLRMDGEVLPNRVLERNEGWGDSVLQSCYTELRNLGAAYSATSNIMEDFIQTILTVNNLSDLMETDEGNEIVKKRLEIIDLSRHVCNTIMLDKEESFSKSSSSVAGLDGLIKRFTLALSSVTGIPQTFLMGEAPSGLQATGAADIRMFYDMIKSEQEDTLKPVLERLMKLMYLSKDGPTRGIEPEDWQIVFNPLWQMSEQEESTYRKTVAETDAIYLDRGVLDPNEIREARFNGGVYSGSNVPSVDESAAPEMGNPNTDELLEYQKTLDEHKAKLEEKASSEKNEALTAAMQKLDALEAQLKGKEQIEKEYMSLLKKIVE